MNARLIAKTRTLDGEAKEGPAHLVYEPMPQQTWCGRKIRGFGVRRWTAPLGDVTCPDCSRARGKGRPRAWKSTR